MITIHGHSFERLLRAACVAMILFGASGPAFARVSLPEPIFLGSRTIPCDRGLRIFAKKTVFYPAGKAEWMNIDVPSDLVVYECGYRRARLICAIHTNEIRIRRSSSRGMFEVKCYGPPRRVRGTVAAPDNSENAGGDAAGKAVKPE